MPGWEITPFLARLMACNADDGTACGMAGMPEMQEAFSAAKDKLKGGGDGSKGAEFLKLLRVECLGSPDLPLAPERPAIPRPFSRLVDDQLDVAMVSTIVTAGTLVRLISRKDKSTLKRRGVRFGTPSGSKGTFLSDHVTEKLVARLGRVPADERHFAIAGDEAHGRPYVWFTAKEDLDAALRARTNYTQTAANVARDLLGLVHHGPTSWETGGANHLFALHIPAAVVIAATHMRPAAPQAFDNRRFVLRFDDVSPRATDEWGRTVDLEYFATRSGGKPIGGRERVLLRLQAAIMPVGTRIAFDYLGEVAATRGQVAGRDDDKAFLRLVGRGRPVERLVEQMCG